MQIACKYGNYQIADYLIMNNIDKNINHQNSKGFSAFHLASKSGQLRILKLLVKRGARPDLLTKQGQSALHIACYEGNSNTVEYLIKVLDLDPNLLLNTQTKSNCLHIACKQGFYQIAYFLISNSRVNLRQLNSNGDDCLMIAIKNNDYNMVKFLLFETV